MYLTKQSHHHTHSLIFLATKTKLPQKFFPIIRKIAPAYIQTRNPDVATGSPKYLYDETIQNLRVKYPKAVLWCLIEILLRSV